MEKSNQALKLLKTTIDTRVPELGVLVAVAAVDENSRAPGASGAGLVLFEYADNSALERELAGVRDFFGDVPFLEGEHSIFEQLRGELRTYLAGGLQRGFSVALRPVGTAFQRAAWEALGRVPYGETITYGEQALLLGLSTRYARAVAGANGQNKLPILLPCHRIVGSAGALTGYSGGLSRKEFLLSLEQRYRFR